MGMNVSKGNMYEFVTHTWNTIKGACPHDCSYCYMKRWGQLKPARFDRPELKTDLGQDNFIFVGSSCDMFAQSIPDEWVDDTLDHCFKFNNEYLFQTKNPSRVIDFKFHGKRPVICTTIETNRFYYDVMKYCPSPAQRAYYMQRLSDFRRFVTIEPIMDFDVDNLVELLKRCEPEQVNIGADTGNNGLPEPPEWKIIELVERVSEFSKIERKRNLGRIVKEQPINHKGRS